MSQEGVAVPGFRSLLWLAIAIALCTVPFTSYMPLWLLPGFAGMGWWRLQRARQGKSAPSFSSRGVIFIALIAALVLSGNIGFGLESAIPLYITLLWLKLLEVKDERDLFFAGYLSAFLAGAGVLLDQGLARTIYASFALLAVLAATLGHHLRTGNIDIGIRFALRRAGILLLQAAPAAAVLFLLIPRPQMPFTIERGKGTSGVSDKLKPGDFDKIALSQEIAFRVTFPARQPPAPGLLYWRGLTLTGTDGLGWYREPHRNLRGLTPSESPLFDKSRVIAQEITLLPHMHSWLYVLDAPVYWARGMSMVAGTVLMRDHDVNNPLTYQVSSDPGLHVIDGDAVTRNLCLALPEQLDIRLGNLAQQWREQAGGLDASAADITAAAMAWFREQGFTYSLEPGAMEGDPMPTFLFERRSGFCSHYSSAFALLMRLVRIPSRVVVGYHGGEWNDLGNFLAVRQAHAHAWCEVWEDREQRWLRVDPTSAVVVGDQAARLANDGASAVPGGGGGMWGSFKLPRKWWDYLDTSWQNWMFHYDGSFQWALAQRLGFGAWSGVALIAGGVLGAALCFVVVWWTLRLHGRRSDPVARLYLRWCARLARSGCVRRNDEAPLAFAARAAATLPAREAEIQAVTDAYCDARYRSSDQAALDRLRSTVRAGSGARIANRHGLMKNTG